MPRATVVRPQPDTTPLVDASSGKNESKGEDKPRASGSKSKLSKEAGERKETINVEKEKERKVKKLARSLST